MDIKQKHQIKENLTVSQLSEKIGIHTNSIRRWAKAGIIPNNRDANGYLYFTPEDVEEVKNIVRIKKNARTKSKKKKNNS